MDAVTAVGLMPLGPAATAFNNDLGILGWSPKPTQAPAAHGFDLRKRQRAASANTCGWANGVINTANVITCTAGATCAFYTPSGTIGMVGCTNAGTPAQSGGWQTACYDFIEQATCTGACNANTFNLQCSDTAAMFCQSFTFPADQVSAYACAASLDDASIWLTIETVASSGSLTLTASPVFVAESAVTGWRTEDQSLYSTTTSTYRSSYTGSSSNSYSYTPRRTLAIGTIIGLAITGVGVLAIIAGAIWAWRNHKRKQKRIREASQIPLHAQTQAQQQPLMSQGGAPPGPDNNPHLGANSAGYFSPPAYSDASKLTPSTQVYPAQTPSPVSSPPLPNVVPAQYPQRHPSNVSAMTSPGGFQGPAVAQQNTGYTNTISPVQSPQMTGVQGPPVEMMGNVQVQRPVEMGNTQYQPPPMQGQQGQTPLPQQQQGQYGAQAPSNQRPQGPFYEMG